jgi:hypothetical protein
MGCGASNDSDGTKVQQASRGPKVAFVADAENTPGAHRWGNPDNEWTSPAVEIDWTTGAPPWGGRPPSNSVMLGK